MLAAFLLSKNSPVELRPGDGAIVGIFTGIIAAVIEAFVSIPLQVFNREFTQRIMEKIAEFAEEMPKGWETWLESEASPGFFMLGLVISAVIFSAFGALGGIIGISLFGKKPKQMPQGPSDVPKNSSHSQS